MVHKRRTQIKENCISNTPQKKLLNINYRNFNWYSYIVCVCAYFAAKFLLTKLKKKVKMKVIRTFELVVMAIIYIFSASLLFTKYGENINETKPNPQQKAIKE